MHPRTQSNSPALFSSFAPEIFQRFEQRLHKSPVIIESKTENKVILRTQEHFDKLESILFSTLKHKSSGRRSAQSYMLKMLIGRHIRKGSCITRQCKIGQDMWRYGYDKNLSVKQIGRIGKSLEDAGLLTRERTVRDKKYRCTYKYKPTNLGLDVYYFYILDNKSNVRLRLLELPDKNQKMSGLEPIETPMIPGVVEKNVRSNMDKEIKENININKYALNALLSNLPQIPIPSTKPEEKPMLQAEIELQKPKASVSETPEKAPGRIDYNATPIDLDAPPADILFFNWDHELTGDRINTVKLGRGNYRIPEGSSERQSEIQTKPHVAERSVSGELLISIAKSNLSNEDKRIIICEFTNLEAGDETKLRILDSIVRLVHTRIASGKKNNNIAMITKAQITHELRTKCGKILSTGSVDNLKEAQ